jgi:hypothetical protein
VLQVAAFASLVVSATFLGHPDHARRGRVDADRGLTDS